MIKGSTHEEDIAIKTYMYLTREVQNIWNKSDRNNNNSWRFNDFVLKIINRTTSRMSEEGLEQLCKPSRP